MPDLAALALLSDYTLRTVALGSAALGITSGALGSFAVLRRQSLLGDAISHAAERDGQYGPAVRAEELLGKAAGMWIDQSLQLTGVLSDSHVAALVAGAKQRQLQPVDNRDSDDD